MKAFIADIIKEIITDRIDDIKAFLTYPKKALVKPEDWSDLDEDEQKEWKIRYWDFMIPLIALVTSIIALTVSMSLH